MLKSSRWKKVVPRDSSPPAARSKRKKANFSSDDVGAGDLSFSRAKTSTPIKKRAKSVGGEPSLVIDFSESTTDEATEEKPKKALRSIFADIDLEYDLDNFNFQNGFQGFHSARKEVKSDKENNAINEEADCSDGEKRSSVSVDGECEETCLNDVSKDVAKSCEETIEDPLQKSNCYNESSANMSTDDFSSSDDELLQTIHLDELSFCDDGDDQLLLSCVESFEQEESLRMMGDGKELRISDGKEPTLAVSN